MMDQHLVRHGLNVLRNYADRNSISVKPDEIVECHPDKEGFLGVACMWNDLGKRTAVKLDRGGKEEVSEIRRLFEAS